MIPLLVTIEALAAAPSPDTGVRTAPVSVSMTVFDFSHPGYAGRVYRERAVLAQSGGLWRT